MYDEQSFIRGSNAKVIVQPKLFVNNVPVNLSNINDPRISVLIINSNNVLSTISYNDIKLSHKEDFEIEIPIQQLIKSISIKFQGEVKKLNGETHQIMHEHTINF